MESQRIDRVVEIETKRLAAVHGSSDVDEHMGAVGEDAPISGLVGVGQIGACYVAAETHVIKLASTERKQAINVTQALPKS